MALPPIQLFPRTALYFSFQTRSSQQHTNFSGNHLHGIYIKINRRPFCNQTRGGTGKKRDRSLTWRSRKLIGTPHCSRQQQMGWMMLKGLSLLPQNTPVAYLGSTFHFFSRVMLLLTPTLNSLPHSTHLMGPAPCPRSPLGFPVPTAELCSQAGNGEQEAEQCQGPHHDADEGSEADGELLTAGTARGEDGEGHAAVEGMEIRIQGRVAVQGGIAQPGVTATCMWDPQEGVGSGRYAGSSPSCRGRCRSIRQSPHNRAGNPHSQTACRRSSAAAQAPILHRDGFMHWGLGKHHHSVHPQGPLVSISTKPPPSQLQGALDGRDGHGGPTTLGTGALTFHQVRDVLQV